MRKQIDGTPYATGSPALAGYEPTAKHAVECQRFAPTHAVRCCPFRQQIAFALWTKRHVLKHCTPDRGLTGSSYFAGSSLPDVWK